MHRTTLSRAALAGALALAAPPVSGQTVELLPQVGVSSVEYSTDLFDSSTGLGLEIGGKVRIGGRFYVEPGIFFSSSGADVSEIDGDEEGNLTLGDFRIPLVVGLKIIRGRVVALRAFGGGGVAFVSSVSGDGALSEVEDEDITSTLWNARAGVGLDFTLFSADVGYDWGLTNLVADPDEEDDDVSRNGFFLEAGLRFGF